MLLEIVSSSVLGSIALYAKFKQTGLGNDSDKLQKIFTLTGLNIKDGQKTYTTQLLKKVNYSWGTEYRYRIPLGRSFQDYQAKFNHIQDGLNNRKTTLQITLEDIKTIDFKKKLIPQIKKLLTKKKSSKKEIELSYDGLLKIKVYEKPMPTRINYTDLSFVGDGWKVPVGQIRDNNELILHDFDKIPHFVLGGATRYGKSTFLNMLITTLLTFQPENVRLSLVDLKGGIEFFDYQNVKQVVNIAFEPDEACEALKAVVEEMREKQRLFRSQGFKNVQEANDPVRHFIIIDEVGELNPSESVDKKDIVKDGIIIHKSEKTIKEECQTYMSQIARLGAGLGYRQILATQYGTGDIIPRQCKQNSDAKLCFRVQNGTASRVVLDENGAEELPEIRGRAIYQTADRRQIVQTPMIETKEIKKAIQPHVVIKAREERIDASQTESGGKTGTNTSELRKIQFLD